MNQVAGSIRFNTDSLKLELYRGNEWVEIDATSPEQETGGTRGLWAGGNTPTYFNNIQFVNIQSTGNAADFGDLTRSGNQINAVSNRVRAIYGAHYTGSAVSNTMDFVAIASTGDATNFGDLTSLRSGNQPMQNATRGIFAGGMDFPAQNAVDVIDYITMASEGNAVDFGDFNVVKRTGTSACSPTRGVISRGSPSTNAIEYFTISTLGNGTDFGDATTADVAPLGTSSNAVRGINWTSSYAPNTADVIDFITIATLGNALDFGDMNHISYNGGACCASPTRSVVGGGFDGGIAEDMDYVQIMTTGNAKDFGDLDQGRSEPGACSNGHGGLG